MRLAPPLRGRPQLLHDHLRASGISTQRRAPQLSCPHLAHIPPLAAQIFAPAVRAEDRTSTAGRYRHTLAAPHIRALRSLPRTRSASVPDPSSADLPAKRMTIAQIGVSTG